MIVVSVADNEELDVCPGGDQLSSGSGCQGIVTAGETIINEVHGFIESKSIIIVFPNHVFGFLQRF